MEPLVILVRFGEIGLKGKNRGEFQRQLVRNMRRVLPEGSHVLTQSGRLIIEIPETRAPETILRNLSRIFGITSLSPAHRVKLDDTSIADATLAVARELREQEGTSFTFKVESRRANKHYPRTSPELNVWLGQLLLEGIPDLAVDIHQPDHRLTVEIRHDYAYIMGRSIAGPRGLPVGTAGRGLLLLSGGIDSPVAGWHMQKRGLKVEGIHFHTPPFTAPRARQKVEDLAALLAPWGDGVILHLVHFTEIARAIHEHCPRRLQLTVMRRMMLRVAEALAQPRGIGALITGESLGQVASQTLENITATNQVVATLPILRPLIGFDKEEIVERARMIGTYETSILPFEDCCTVFVPHDPKTTPALAAVDEAERDLPVDALVRGALQDVERKSFDWTGQLR